MATTEALVDLSLFDWAPTGQRSSQFLYSKPIHKPRTHTHPPPTVWAPPKFQDPVREFYAPRPRTKPQPPRLDTSVAPVSAPRRLLRTDTSDSPSALLQRRNISTTPQLTLSVPGTTTQPKPPASSMVWMPDEQMWLVVSDAQEPTRSQYPTPPAYSPREYPRSEPAIPSVSDWGLTPPPTPLQNQLQSLLDREEEEAAAAARETREEAPWQRDEQNIRDDDRLSPLFHEAMNSVPLTDPLHLPPPPSYEGTMRRENQDRIPTFERASTFERMTDADDGPITRARTTMGFRSRSRTQSSSSRSVSQRDPPGHVRARTATNTPRVPSIPTLPMSDGSPPSVGSKNWMGLAKKIARPSSAA